MIKRMVDISERPAHLSVKHAQLLIEPKDEGAPVARIPCEDIGVVVVDQAGVTYSHQALMQLMEAGAMVLLCGRNHLPAGYLLPYPAHSEVTTRVHDQVNASQPLKKRLWKQIVSAKIRGQAANLDKDSPERKLLDNLAGKVRSGDPANVEAQAAKIYWKAWLGPGVPFRRAPRGGDGVNGMLDYGYALVRAGVSRATAGVGLLPMLGLHHANRANAFCLADDLIEPLRPLVDAKVRALHADGTVCVDKTAKAALLGLLNDTVSLGDEAMPLQIAVKKMLDSLVHCYGGTARVLYIPAALPSAAATEH